MFIRKKPRNDPKTRKEYFCYQLVESVRTPRGPRQKIILSLGASILDDFDDTEIKMLAQSIEESMSGQKSLLEYPEKVKSLSNRFSNKLAKREIKEENYPTQKEQFQEVSLNSIEHSDCRTIGVEHLVFEAMKTLKLDQAFSDQGFSKIDQGIAMGLVLARLVSPGSERATHNWLKNTSGAEELLKVDFNKCSKNKLYKLNDNIILHKKAIENHLESVEKDLFSIRNTVLLYDLTNTYFEGSAKRAELAQRGHSKEKRTDCPLVTLGLVLNEKGFPSRSEVLPGNISEPSTLASVLENLSSESLIKPTVVLDGGIATKANLEYMRAKNIPYIVSSRSRSCALPEGLSLEDIKDDGSVKGALSTAEDDSGENLLYCYSEDREKKEEGIFKGKKERFLKELEKAKKALSNKRGIKSFPKVLERIGRLKERYKKVSSYYTVEVEKDEESEQASNICWKEKEEKISERFNGCYLIRTYGVEGTARELWRIYTMLTEVEEGFRCLKSELGMRPVYHQKKERIDAHLFISVLAYHVMRFIQLKLKSSGIQMRWNSVREVLSTQNRITTTMQTRGKKTLILRLTSKATPEQEKIYNAMSISNSPCSPIKKLV